jgi:N-acetylneuraminic acid mutarotase
MNKARTASCAAAVFALAVSFAANAQDETCDRNHYILDYPVPPSSAAWIATGNLNLARSGHTATLLADGRVLVAGGVGTGPAALASAEIYDPATEQWTFTGNLTKPRVGHTATLLPSGKVLVIGGDGGLEPTAGTAELYDPATGGWTATSAPNTRRWAFTATLLNTGKVLVTGGVDIDDNTLVSGELYDPATDTWSYTGRLVIGRFFHTATPLQDGRVLVVGGWFDDLYQASMSAVELYDPVAGTWSSAARLSQARSFHSATTLQDGRVLVAGGYQHDQDSNQDPTGFFTNPTSLDGAELFDPATGTWTIVDNLSRAREGHTATLLPDGEVLVVGGFDWTARQGVTGAELYEVATAAWLDGGSSSPTGSTATLLPNGTVLFAGGEVEFIGATTSLNSAELYIPGGCH